MIKFIAAVDNKLGLATDKGIPWKLPTDLKYYRQKTEGHEILMGHNTYVEFSKPMVNRNNYVFTRDEKLEKPGFTPVHDIKQFVEEHPDAWIIGGAGLFAQSIQFADELYLTHIEGDFHCTKFFPEYEKDFEQVSLSEPITENDITFRFAVYRRKKL